VFRDLIDKVNKSTDRFHRALHDFKDLIAGWWINIFEIMPSARDCAFPSN
jgi:hypothetical protein